MLGSDTLRLSLPLFLIGIFATRTDGKQLSNNTDEASVRVELHVLLGEKKENLDGLISVFFDDLITAFPKSNVFEACFRIVSVDKNSGDKNYFCETALYSAATEWSDIDWLKDCVVEVLDGHSQGKNSMSDSWTHCKGTPRVNVHMEKRNNWSGSIPTEFNKLPANAHLMIIVNHAGNETVPMMRAAIYDVKKTKLIFNEREADSAFQDISESLANGTWAAVQSLLLTCPYEKINGHCAFPVFKTNGQQQARECQWYEERIGKGSNKAFCLSGHRSRPNETCKGSTICDNQCSDHSRWGECEVVAAGSCDGKRILYYKNKTDRRPFLQGCPGYDHRNDLVTEPCKVDCPAKATGIAMIVIGSVLLILLVTFVLAAYWVLCMRITASEQSSQIKRPGPGSLVCRVPPSTTEKKEQPASVKTEKKEEAAAVKSEMKEPEAVKSEKKEEPSAVKSEKKEPASVKSEKKEEAVSAVVSASMKSEKKTSQRQ